MVFLIVVGICLTIFIVFLVIEIIKSMRNHLINNTDVNDFVEELGAACFFLAPSIAFLIIVILELINKCS